MTEKLYGFQKVDSQYIKELDAKADIYLHARLGAKLLHIPNDDQNKVFAIQFVTLPEDDTGISHILEHAVLAGSEKFPVKEPFVNLLKGSLNTFLNAMTMPDKTIYPFASLNEKDFLNILDVYLDAVFAPNIKHDPLILKQEGWRIEQFDKAEAPTFNGVVYNEMKGALASPDEKLNMISRKLLFDNTYQYESGGDPRAIPELTQADFLDFYESNYHPSNSYIYLYGDMPKEPVFKILAERFAEYEPLQSLPKVEATTKLTKPQYQKAKYAGSKEDLNYAQIQLIYTKNKLEMSRIEEYSLQIAINALFNLESSQIKQNIVEKGIAQDIYAYSNTNSFNPSLSVVLVAVNPNQKPQELEEIIFRELKNTLASDQKASYLAALNNLSFSLRESDTQSIPQGLIHGIKALVAWPYEISPYDALSYEDALEKVAEKIEQNKIKPLFEKYVVNNLHRATILIEPDNNVATETLKQEANKLNSMFDALSEEEKADNIKMNVDLRHKQETPDSPEALASLPVLEIADLQAEKDYQMVVETNLQTSDRELPVITYLGPSRGISYLNYQFNLDEISQDELFELSLFQSLLGMIKTQNFSYGDLTNQILANTGGISSSLVYQQDKRYLNVRLKVLENQLETGIELVEEILIRSEFLDSKERIYQLLYMIFSRFQMSLADNGMELARKRLSSYFSPEGAFNEAISGISLYENLKQLLKTWDENGTKFVEKLNQFTQTIFTQNNFSLFFAGEEALYEKAQVPLIESIEKFPISELDSEPQVWNFDLTNKKEAFTIPTEIQFNLAGNNLFDLDPDFQFHGSIHVLRQILNTDYLWTALRVKGGAYGAGFSLNRLGNMYFSSYRDPQCRKTFEAYKNIPNYLRNLSISESEWTSYIIGTFAGLDQPLSFPAEARRARNWYDQNISAEQMQKERSEALRTTPAEIKSYASIIEKSLETEYFCSLGSENKLKADKDLFKVIKTLD